MGKFKLGDIVNLKLLGEAHYYIITGFTDYTQEDDEQPDIDCDMILIYPISKLEVVETINQEELNLVAGFKSKDYNVLMDYISRERERMGIFIEPEYLRIVNHDGKPVVNKTKKVERKMTNFGEKDIQKMMNNNDAEIKIETFVGKMNDHLDLLSKAIEEENTDEINSQKEHLEEVRKTLMELEYFQLSKRRSGTSIKVK